MLIGIDASRANIANRTGTERYAWEVIRRLVITLTDHQIRLYVREPLLPDWPTMDRNVQVRILRWPPGALWSHIRLSWELLWHRPEVLFVPADTVPLIHPARTVTTIHDIAFERFPELYHGKNVQRKIGWWRPIINLGVKIMTRGKYGPSELDYHRWSVRHALRSCQTILTVSNFTKQELVQILHARPERIIVTPLGIRQEHERSKLTTDSIRSIQHQYGLIRPYLYFVGRLESKKNIALLIESYHHYRQGTPSPVDLVLIGSPGHGWPAVEADVEKNHLSEFIHILGWQSDQIADAIHAGSEALIFISQYEGFGLPALESLAIGVPVIASRQGSLPEVLGPAAYYVDLTRADVARGIAAVLADQGLRQQLNKLGRTQIKRYSWDVTAQKTMRVLVKAPLS